MNKYYNNDENNLITLSDLEKNKEGIICLSGGANGPIGKSILYKNSLLAEKIFKNLNSIYEGNFFIELTRSGLDDEKKTENFFLSLANKFNIPIVAKNNNYILNVCTAYGFKSKKINT